jgi:hypothetical protein
MNKQSFVERVEIVGRDEIRGWSRRRRHHGIRELKARAAAGDQWAIAKLQRLRDSLATATTPATPAGPAMFASSLTPAPTYAPPVYSPYVPPTYQTPYYDASLAQDPLGPPPQPTIDVFQGDELGILLDDLLDPVKPRGSEFVLGREKTPEKFQNKRRKIEMASKNGMYVGRQEILGKDEILGRSLDSKLNRRKTSSEFVLGDDVLTEIVSSGAFVGDDEKQMAREGGASERASLLRRKDASCGYNSHWAHVRGDATATDLDKIKKLAEGGNRKAKKILARIEKLAKSETSGDDSSQAERQEARKILDAAVAAKSISRDDLKKAVWLYAGKQSTEKERAAVGSKMIAFLNKRQVTLA